MLVQEMMTLCVIMEVLEDFSPIIDQMQLGESHHYRNGRSKASLLNEGCMLYKDRSFITFALKATLIFGGEIMCAISGEGGALSAKTNIHKIERSCGFSRRHVYFDLF